MRLLPVFLVLVTACSTPVEDGLTTFEVDMTREIAEGRFRPGLDAVGIRGSVTPLSWGETLMAEDPDGDSIYVVRVALPVSREPARFKFKVEADDPGQGWEDGRDRLVGRTVAGERVRRAFNDPPPPVPRKLTGTIEAHPGIESAFLDLPRDVWVYLPPGYADSEDRYPVLYMQDGHAVFDGSGSGFEWGADETAEALITEGAISPVIIVAIGATSARMTEFTPTLLSDPQAAASGGRGADYVRFLVDELKPFIDARYRTNPTRTAVGGASLGGLISIFAGILRPDIFEGVLAVSPSVWWDNESILARVRESTALPLRIWVDVGDEETSGMVSGARTLARELESLERDSEVHLEIAEGAGHHELAWAARFPDMLGFLYGREPEAGR